MTTGRINQVADGPTCGARQPRSLRRRGLGDTTVDGWCALDEWTNSSFSCEAVLHGQRWARGFTAHEHLCLPTSRCSPRRCPWEEVGDGYHRRSRSFRGDSRLRWRRADADRTEDSRPLANAEQTPIDHVWHEDQTATSAVSRPTDTSFPANAQHRTTASRVATTLDAQPSGPRALSGCLTITQMATTNAIVCYRELGLCEERNNKTTVQALEPVRHSQPQR